MPQSYWSTIAQVEPNIGKTKQGKPVREITAHNNKKLSLLGGYDMLAKLAPGAIIQHSEPSEFGKRFYATLELIDPPPAAKPAQAAVSTNGNGQQAPSALRTWKEVKEASFEIHKHVTMLEGDGVDQQPDSNPVYFEKARARSAMYNTLMMGFLKGQFALPAAEPDIPGLDAPMPDDEGFPWERAS
jgi:hypothetical protein